MTLKEVPPLLHKHLVSSAKTNGRSLNKEILFILQEQVFPKETSRKALLERIRQRRVKLGIQIAQKEIEKMIDEG